MSDFRARVLGRLARDYGVDEDFIAGSLAQVIRGEQIREEYVAGALVKEVKVRKPRDIMAGLAVLDKLTEGAIGVSEDVVEIHGRASLDYGAFRPVLPEGADENDVIFNAGLDETADTMVEIPVEIEVDDESQDDA